MSEAKREWVFESIRTTCNRQVVIISAPALEGDEQIELADGIVNAVNNHPALLEACKAAEGVMAKHVYPKPDVDDASHPWSALKQQLKRFLKWLTGDYWTVVRTTWPYPEGYGTYNEARRTLLDSGLSKEGAEASCQELNSVE